MMGSMQAGSIGIPPLTGTQTSTAVAQMAAKEFNVIILDVKGSWSDGKDPYVIVEYGQQSGNTSTKQDAGKEAVFNEQIGPFAQVRDEVVVFKVCDQDKGQDDFLGATNPLNPKELPRDDAGVWQGTLDIMKNGRNTGALNVQIITPMVEQQLSTGVTEYIVGAIHSTRPIARMDAVVTQEITEVRVPSDVQETIVEIPMERIVERIVEIPEVQTVEKIVEVPQVQVVTKTVETVVEEIVQVPKVEYQEEIIERQVEQVVTVQRTVEVPQIQKRIIQQPVEQIIEEIVQVPKIEYREKLVERQIEQIQTVQRTV